MGSMVSGLADAVLGVVQGVGLSSGTVARYGKCCEAVVAFCGRRGFDALSGSVVEEFVACQQERARHGEIGRNRRNALVKTARMMLEFQRTGAVTWQMMSPDPGLGESSREVLEQFAAAAGQEVAPGSVRLLAGEIRQFLAYLDRAGRGALGAVTADHVRGFLVEVAPRRTAGTGNVVWSLKRFFAFLNAAGLSDVRVDGLLARAAPRRVRALPCFTRAETGRLINGIDTGTPCGKRDSAMVALAVSTRAALLRHRRAAAGPDRLAPRRDPAGPGQDVQAAGAAAAGTGGQRRRGVDPARPAGLRRPGSVRPAPAAVREAGELGRLDPHAPPPGPGRHRSPGP